MKISPDHVVEEDAQAPHGQLAPVVALLDDPLGRRVHVGPCNITAIKCPLKSLKLKDIAN